ncbi:unnamed protein product [Cylicostephanus goldi]|uniref:TFIIS central domain-containing protein n=1 Tax=Cylicostephanus goldi TaxID=71465 RepID=A0A3P6RSE7_CYLGO|nr:unnamed protein product [Cylicostephanus goldi]
MPPSASSQDVDPVKEELKEEIVEPSSSQDKPEVEEKTEIRPDEKSGRKRKRSSSSSSSCSSSSSGRHSDDESTQTKPTAKKKSHGERPCVECGRWLDDCAPEWKEILGPSSVWCSRECIERRVARAHEVLREDYGALTLLRGDGQLLTTGPTLVNLAEFIFKYPEYEPVLPVARKKTHAKSEDTSHEQKKSASKVLSKDSDRTRFNVKRAFSDALVKRAKMDKIKSAVKLCKDTAEAVEAALFKHCNSNPNSPKYKNWTKMFIENVTDHRNKGFYHRVLTGAISVYKVVTLEGADMGKPEYAAPINEDGSGVEEANILSEEVSATTSAANENVKPEAEEPVAVERVAEVAKGTGSGAAMSETDVSKSSLKRDPSFSRSNSEGVKPRRTSSKRSDARKVVTTIDAILGDGAKDTTEQHLSHFYDVNCSICLAKQKQQAEAERKEREEKEKQREEERRFREVCLVSDRILHHFNY